MRDQKRRGNTILEFCLVMMILLPMLLFTFGVGINLLTQLEVIQLTRDAGHMYVTLHEVSQVDMSSTTFLNILDSVGASAGYLHTGGNAQVIFVGIMYVDDPTCILAGLGAGCANSGQWAYTQYYVTPASLPSSISGFTPTFNAPSYGTTDPQKLYTLAQTAGQSGLRITPNVTSTLGIVPSASNPVLGLPSGQQLYFVEVGAAPFNMPGVTSLSVLRDYAVF
jgi:hypothetical protein